MIRAAAPLALLLALSPAFGAERRQQVGSFERVRVSGPFEVTFTTGSPSARVIGDARAIEGVEVRVDGPTLTVRASPNGWGERPRGDPGRPIAVALSSPALSDALVLAGGRLRIDRVKGARLAVSVNGAGAIAVADAQVDRLDASLLGAGSVTLAGRARAANLRTSGSGRIDAGALEADALSVVLDGPGETAARARYSADVTNIGLGAVTVAGRPRCTVKAPAGGLVRCGD